LFRIVPRSHFLVVQGPTARIGVIGEWGPIDLSIQMVGHFFREMNPRTLLANSSENPKRALERE
jgi:hypothetical protein